MDLRLAPVALGCWAAALATLHLGWKAGFAMIGFLLLIGAGLLRWKPQWRWIGLAVLVGLVCGAVATGARLSERDNPKLVDLVSRRATTEVELTVRDDPRLALGATGRSNLWVVRASLARADGWHRVNARVLVLAEDDAWRNFVPGQRVRVTVRFGPSRGGDLKAAVLSAVGAPVPLGEPALFQIAAADLRAGLQKACAPLDDLQGGLLPGLVVGDTSRLDPELEQQFRDAGLTHLTAVSGSNIALVAGCIILIARRIRLGPRWTAALAALAVVGFVILVRPSPSVLRAALMGGVGLLALTSGRKRAALPALGATVTALLVLDPELASEAGFALSVMATGGLLILAPSLRDALTRRGVPGGVAEALAIPASAQLACAPVIAGISGTVSLVAVPANLLAVPAVAPATISGVVAATLSPIWPAGAQFAAWLGSWPAWWLVKVAQVSSAVPAGALPWPAGVGGALLLAALTLALLLGFRSQRVRRVVVVVALAAVVGAVPLRMVGPGWPPSGWIIAVCDVGQGDAVVLRAGDGSAVLIDAGPELEPVSECLRALGIRSLALVFLSHLHLDHIGGLRGVLPYKPSQIIIPAYPEPQAGREAVIRAAGTAGVPMVKAARGTVWTAGEVTLRVLYTPPLAGTRSDPNNNSLVLQAEVLGVRVLLLGDAETEQQQLLRDSYPGLRTDVLKIAHHGSAYQDPVLLDEAAPRIALVSVGAGNDYGHPNPALMARLLRGGTRVLRTDVDGDVAVVLDEGRLMVSVR